MKKKRVLSMTIVCILLLSMVSFASTTYWLNDHYWTTSSTAYTYWLMLVDQQEFVDDLKDELDDLNDQLRQYEDQEGDLIKSIISDISFITGYGILVYAGDKNSIIGLGESAYSLYLDVKDLTSNDDNLNDILDDIEQISKLLNTETNKLKDLHETVWETYGDVIGYAP